MGVAVYSEEDLLPISALQHLLFCERQWALIHLERLWSENRLTAEGRILHDKAHEAESESRGDVRIARGLRLRSLRLGLTGVADVVEFRRLPEAPVPSSVATTAKAEGVALSGVAGFWRPFPVEYKRGRPKPDASDEVQLCAQALCLEEALGVEISTGALFYGKPRRRHEVTFDDRLRKQTEGLTLRLHELTRKGQTPPAVYEKKCESCSLFDLCLPKTTTGRKSVSRYLSSILDNLEEAEEKAPPCDTY